MTQLLLLNTTILKMIYAEGMISKCNFNVCSSWVLLPGFYVASKAVLIIAYALALFYIFLGISIVSDVFMK